jgi:signal transduction histidine kinase
MAELAIAGWMVAAVLVHRALGARERVARACHELRGPLTAAGLALTTMARLGEAPAERLAALDEQLRRAALALEDLGEGEVDRIERLPVAHLLAGLHVTWSPVCAAAGRPLVVGVAPQGLALLADRTRLAQAAGNLVANALEHGEGAIEVRPRCAGGVLRIEVRDGGRGLGRPLREIVRRPRAGLGRRGRGLAIAASIARRHGGALSTAPGAAVVLELPLLAAGVSAASGEATR